MQGMVPEKPQLQSGAEEVRRQETDRTEKAEQGP
jgi:hypothetical protein